MKNIFSERKFPVFPRCVQHTVWKDEKFSLTKKIFRQINSLLISLVKALLSRNFCQKCVRLNCSDFHTVAADHSMWKNEKFTLAAKFFRQINSSVISLVKSLVSRNFCKMMH